MQDIATASLYRQAFIAEKDPRFTERVLFVFSVHFVCDDMYVRNVIFLNQ
jgi:hypothetical protein